jgi:hypothetical protein
VQTVEKEQNKSLPPSYNLLKRYDARVVNKVVINKITIPTISDSLHYKKRHLFIGFFIGTDEYIQITFVGFGTDEYKSVTWHIFIGLADR